MNIALRCWRKTDPVDATRNVNLQVNHLVIISLRQRLNSFISVSCHELGIKWYICVAAGIRSHGLSHRISVGHFNNMTRLWGAVHAKLCLFFTRLIWETRNIPMKNSSLSCISLYHASSITSRGATLLCHIGMCHPKGYSFCAVSFWKQV